MNVDHVPCLMGVGPLFCKLMKLLAQGSCTATIDSYMCPSTLQLCGFVYAVTRFQMPGKQLLLKLRLRPTAKILLTSTHQHRMASKPVSD